MTKAALLALIRRRYVDLSKTKPKTAEYKRIVSEIRALVERYKRA
jgi:hypothetical protein